jgi:hypothetical protein
MTVAPGAPSGFSAVYVAGSDVTAEIGRGTLGGRCARDTLIPAYETRLDQLAFDVATAISGVHNTGRRQRRHGRRFLSPRRRR